jgi:esterase/lipase superfamily enzyme
MTSLKYLTFCRTLKPVRVSDLVLLLALLFSLTSCAKPQSNQIKINLMPAPDVYDSGAINPFTDTSPIDLIPYDGILYATDREPATDEDKEDFYQNKRGLVLRLGIGKTALGKTDITWEEARRISLLKNRPDSYPIKITGARELGILDKSYTVFTTPGELGPEDREPAENFAKIINEKLSQSTRKDIYIYVHGYKVVFENPLLVATELWHFLGYDGVFIAYAWPSTPKRLAYASDLETAALSSHNLSILLEYLAEETDAENIHIIGYSAGTRLVINALMQLASAGSEKSDQELQEQLRIGQVIIVGSDFDRQLVGAYLVNGLLKASRSFNVYLSETDKALGVSQWVFRRERVGQMPKNRDFSPQVKEYIRKTPNLHFIDISEAEDSAAGNGHAYFRQSPWVSSDILTTLMYDLSPEQRGLERTDEWPIWVFPSDYITRLTKKMIEVNPALAPLGEQEKDQ